MRAPLRLAGPIAICLVAGCLRANDEFVEPAGEYGDCAVNVEACQDGLLCQEIPDRAGGDPGFMCAPRDCERDDDCPRPDDGVARPECRGGGRVCILDCTPIQCDTPGVCDLCPDQSSCAAGCGPGVTPQTNTHCVPCPDGMDCIVAQPGDPPESRPMFWCGFR